MTGRPIQSRKFSRGRRTVPLLLGEKAGLRESVTPNYTRAGIQGEIGLGWTTGARGRLNFGTTKKQTARPSFQRPLLFRSSHSMHACKSVHNGMTDNERFSPVCFKNKNGKAGVDGGEWVVAGECELRSEALVGWSLPRRPDIGAAEHHSPTIPRIRADRFLQTQRTGHG